MNLTESLLSYVLRIQVYEASRSCKGLKIMLINNKIGRVDYYRILYNKLYKFCEIVKAGTFKVQVLFLFKL